MSLEVSQCRGVRNWHRLCGSTLPSLSSGNHQWALVERLYSRFLLHLVVRLLLLIISAERRRIPLQARQDWLSNILYRQYASIMFIKILSLPPPPPSFCACAFLFVFPELVDPFCFPIVIHSFWDMLVLSYSILLLILPAFIAATNDWNTPCTSGVSTILPWLGSFIYWCY